MIEYKIMNPIKGLIKYEPYEFQKDLIKDLVEDDQNVILYGSRHMGISTTLIYCIRELCFKNSGYKAIYVTVNNNIVKSKLEHFANNIDGFKYVKSQYKIQFDNGSEILFYPSKPIIGYRLEGYDIFYDNYEFISKNFLFSFKACLVDCRERFFSFTGNNEFSLDGYKIVKWNWDLHPTRNQDWRDEQSELLGEKQAERELDVK